MSSSDDISFMKELNLLITMPLQWLIVVIVLFVILLNNLSLMNLLLFIVIYAVITRIHLSSYQSPTDLQDEENEN